MSTPFMAILDSICLAYLTFHSTAAFAASLCFTSLQANLVQHVVRCLMDVPTRHTFQHSEQAKLL